MKFFVFSVIAFNTIKIQTYAQNDCLNHSFVKYINVVGKKMTKNGLKMVISIVTIHLDKSDFNLIVLAP